MPVKPTNHDPYIVDIIKGRLQTTSIWLPDVNPWDNITTPATYTQQPQDLIPPNFKDFPPEEQKRLMERYRYGGIPCRADIDGPTVPITKETLDLP